MHGFRATLTTWANEHTEYDSRVIEVSVAHSVKGAVEAAYNRGDLFKKRQALMEDWGQLCSTPPAPNVISFPSGKGK
jgi:integrase